MILINACLLAYFLLGPASEKEGATALAFSYEKDLVANYLGMEPESLSGGLKDLQKTGHAIRGQRAN